MQKCTIGPQSVVGQHSECFYIGPGVEIVALISSILTELLFFLRRHYYWSLRKIKFDATINTFWLFAHTRKGTVHPKPAMKALNEAGWLTLGSGRLAPGNVFVPIVEEAG